VIGFGLFREKTRLQIWFQFPDESIINLRIQMRGSVSIHQMAKMA